jgi:NAD(P)-dependent dehydrogenase (short-subunit alcohol dehydrogenase family)
MTTASSSVSSGRVTGKVAFVTGAGRGIGRATAIMLAQHGAKVAVADRDADVAQEVVDTIESMGGEAALAVVDVADEDGVRQVIGEVVDRWNRIDVLVNCAGLAGIQKPIHEVTTAEYDRVMDVNVRGIFHTTKYAIPAMTNGGSVINFSSIYGLVGGASAESPYSVYQASKGAVLGMSRGDAMMYASQGIRVNSICPGFIDTPMVAGFLERTGDAAAARTAAAALHPLGDLGEPDDIAYGVLYLASDESKFVTGTALVIDGGMTAA